MKNNISERDLKQFVTADLKASTEGCCNKKDGKVFHSFKVTSDSPVINSKTN